MKASFKGIIQIGMVTLPIKAYTATEERSVQLKTLCRCCNLPIKQLHHCATTEKVLGTADKVKGYEFNKAHYAVIEQAEIDALRPETERALRIDHFIDEKQLNPLMIERTMYVGPGVEVAIEAFSTIREALRGRIGIGKMPANGKDNLVGVRAHGNALVLHILRYIEEIRPLEGVDDLDRCGAPNKQHLAMAKQLVSNMSHAAPEWGDYTDTFRENLMDLVKSRIDGTEPVALSSAPPAPTMHDMLAALEASLKQAERPARATQSAPKTTVKKARAKRAA